MMRHGCALLIAVVLSVGTVTPAAADWPFDPAVNVPICTVALDQRYPEIVSDGDGGAIVVWHDSRVIRGYNIYAQHIDADGDTLWAGDGLAVTSVSGYPGTPFITSDGEGGVIIVFDWMGTTGQRLDADGTKLWGDEGVTLEDALGTWSVFAVVPDSMGGAIVGGGFDNPDGIFALRVRGDGEQLWGEYGAMLVPGSVYDHHPKDMVPDGSGGAFMTWEDWTDPYHSVVRLQHVNSNGDTLWGWNGLRASEWEGSWEEDPHLAYDDDGGVFVTWTDWVETVKQVLVQHFDGSGQPQWAADGLIVCPGGSNKWQPRVASDGSGGCVVAWADLANGNQLLAQRLNASGQRTWGPEGVTVIPASLPDPQIMAAGDGGFIFSSGSLSISMELLAAKLDSCGSPLWGANGVLVSGGSGGRQLYPCFTTDGAGGAIFAWSDDRGDDCDIYAQRVQATGYLGTGIDEGLPSERTLRLAGYPNPSRPGTRVAFELPESVRVTLRVYDVSGRLVASLLDERLAAGPHELAWDGLSDAGRKLPSGVYFCRLSGGSLGACVKLVIIE